MNKFKLDAEQRNKIAEQLYIAEKDCVPISTLTSQFPEITLEDAYDIQKTGLNMRLADGATVIGRKIGITSRGMMKQLNCDTPDYGYLLDSMIVCEGSSCKRKGLNIPIIEGEIAFIMGEDLKGPGITTADILNSTAWIVPCFEVCDARYDSWNVTVKDTISDNAGASRFVLGGKPKRVSEVNLRCIGMVIEKNGVLVSSAAGAEVMGNPLNSMMWLANKLSEYSDGLHKGDIVLSGSFMAALPCDVGDSYCLSVDGFPSLTLKFE